MMLISDCEKHPFFRHNQYHKETGVRFYAGIPIVIPANNAMGQPEAISIGAICLLSSDPVSQFNPNLLDAVAMFIARCLMNRIEFPAVEPMSRRLLAVSGLPRHRKQQAQSFELHRVIYGMPTKNIMRSVQTAGYIDAHARGNRGNDQGQQQKKSRDAQENVGMPFELVVRTMIHQVTIVPGSLSRHMLVFCHNPKDEHEQRRINMAIAQNQNKLVSSRVSMFQISGGSRDVVPYGHAELRAAFESGNYDGCMFVTDILNVRNMQTLMISVTDLYGCG